ncbi:MAG TPA: hypothetical protein DEQ72_09710 [Lachnospiraceae bacterium]|jgi:hypothetical protein|nr:hypothetical protein [Lachnospiraceae bacterium]
MKGGCAVMCGRFFVFYSSLEGSVFFRLYAKRGSWNRKKKVAVENEKVVVHKKIKYSIKS